MNYQNTPDDLCDKARSTGAPIQDALDNVAKVVYLFAELKASGRLPSSPPNEWSDELRCEIMEAIKDRIGL